MMEENKFDIDDGFDEEAGDEDLEEYDEYDDYYSDDYIVDLAGVDSEEALHERLAEALPLPDYYGHNLDALYDVLTEQGDGWHVTFTGIDSVSDDMREYVQDMLDVFDDASAQVEDMTYEVEGEEEETDAEE